MASISLDEFSNYLDGSAFVQHAQQVLLSVDKRALRDRKGNVKRLIEEILPIAAFVKHLDEMGAEPVCKHHNGNQSYDAEVRLGVKRVSCGLLKDSYYVEVTCAVHPKAYLFREALNRQGSCWLNEAVYREGSRKRGDDRIVSKPTAEDAGEPLRRLKVQIIERIREKSSKRYPSPCILLVSAVPDFWACSKEWVEMLGMIRDHVDVSAFDHVYVVNYYTHFVFRL